MPLFQKTIAGSGRDGGSGLRHRLRRGGDQERRSLAGPAAVLLCNRDYCYSDVHYDGAWFDLRNMDTGRWRERAHVWILRLQPGAGRAGA